jgi:site-specific recombinase XerD
MKRKYQIKTERYKVIIDGFESFINQGNFKSVSSYITAIAELLLWLETKGITNIKKVRQHDIQSYSEYLINRPNERTGGVLSESFIKNQLHSLRLFFDYLMDAGYNDKSFLLPKFVIKHHPPRNIVTRDEMTELFDKCETQFERAILAICYGCGLRRTEAIRLDIRDILISSGKLIVRIGKHDKRREIPLSDNVIKTIKDYVFEQRNELLKDTSKWVDAFFITTKGKRVSNNYLNNKLKEIIVRTGNDEIINKNITLHCLRHSIATHLVENGAGIEEVRDFLGHVEIDTTQLYSSRRRKHKLLNI